VNAALSQVTGDFTGVFDADHHPDRDSFLRAWRWLSAGYGIVQGHPVVRNGDASWVARTVAVEFEAIYAVSHPGRNRLHTFGIFGGSNGYWRTSLLRETRFRGSMLTEDIDSSLRVVEAGHRIGNDPQLITRELAPTDLTALWNQRMRWAQGWFQVSGKHLVRGWRSSVLTLRQKLGFTFLLGWRELYPWISMQVIPLIAFFAVDRGGLGALDWFIAILLLTTLFTVSVGPATTLFAYWQAEPSIRRHRSWFWAHLLVATFFYTEFKNTIARVAQVKELMGEKAWKITPRSAPSAHAPSEDDRTVSAAARASAGDRA
jgi:cellulose synthase/poly-beta-1,6-N-acetylglucosamine synthase-like glycosyltransferase